MSRARVYIVVVAVSLLAACSVRTEVAARPAPTPDSTAVAAQPTSPPMPAPTAVATATPNAAPTQAPLVEEPLSPIVEAVEDESDQWPPPPAEYEPLVVPRDDVPVCEMVFPTAELPSEPYDGRAIIGIDMSRERAGGGLIRPDTQVAIVTTTRDESGNLTTVLAVDNVHDVETETVYGAEPDFSNPWSDYPTWSRVFLIVDEHAVAPITAACESGSVTLALKVFDGGYAVELELPGSRALDGTVRLGDVVSVLSDGDDVLADPIEVLSVSSILESAGLDHELEGTYFVLVRVSASEMPLVVGAYETGTLSLSQP